MAAPAVSTVTVLVIASVLLQTATSAQLNETVYLVTVSSQAVSGSSETLCAQIHGPSESVSLSVTLSTDSGTTSLLQERGISADYYQCTTFQVPQVTTSTVATINVTVEGERDSMSKKTKILISPASSINIVQTDKPIYKPGQTVQARIVSLDTSFLPVDRVYKTVELQDPNQNRIAQWLDQSVTGGILDLSHVTSPEAAQGTYQITAWTDTGDQISHSFDIKEYVLPKYEVKVLLPNVITILDREATLKVCGQYTYGKPVLGSVKAEVCRRTYRWYWYSGDPKREDICKKFELTTERNGCATQVLNITEFAPTGRMFEDSFDVKAEIEEYGTGVVLQGTGRAQFSTDIRTVTFENVPAAYKPAIPFEGKIKVTGPDSRPVANERVRLTVRYGGEDATNVTLTTDSKGMSLFSLDTSLWKRTVSLQTKIERAVADEPHVHGVRRPEYQEAYLHVAAFYSKSQSFVKVMQSGAKLSCQRDAAVRAQYIIQGQELQAGQELLHFFYIVMSRGSIVQHGRLPVAVKVGAENTGVLSVPLQNMTDLAPFAQVVVYTVMPNGEAVADSQDFPVQLCLNNKVSLRFSSLQELPGEKTSITLQAHPGSLCSLRALDQSVLLLQPEKELSVESVYSELPVQKLSGYSYQVEDYDPYPCLPPLMMPDMMPDVMPDVMPELEEDPVGRRKRSVYFGPNNEKDDVYSIFQEIGVKIVTNSDVKKPYDCSDRFIDLVDAPMPMAFNMMPDGDRAKSQDDHEDQAETVRTFFPETWIWELVPVGDSGSVSVEKTVPDTITKWAAGAFCTSSVGFGLAPNTGLVAFQPFFVSLTLPYSVVRGEVFALKATVFNYLSRCIMVKVTLAESEDFQARGCEGCQYSLCLCGEESRTFKWIVTPTTLGKLDLKVSAEAVQTQELCGNEAVSVPERGRMDTVIRTLLVEAEGTPEVISHNALMCPTDGPVEKNVSLLLPEMFVAGSAKASVSVLGDLMGRAMQNLDSLLAMPYGCGEQNMVLFAPNIYILNYLKSTGQLTQPVLDKAKHFLQSGYQRELTYKHDDHSYSAFGKSDASGNTWLTAFVMKSFGGARPFIFVDPEHILQAKAWLGSKQRPTGCFRSVGKLFHNGMKGGVSDDVSLTAYITAALLELDHNTTDPLVEGGLRCLRVAVAGQLDNLYTTALLAYTFTLAGEEPVRRKLITYLHQQANTEGGTHWTRAGASDKRLDALEVEATSYVLLALLSGREELPGFGLDFSSGIVRWLAQQQNPYGGFASTQDTVVALQALAKYGAATYSPEGATTVLVTSLGGLRKEFTVDQSNRLLYREEPLTDVPGEYNIRAEGRGCVLAQIAMRFNIPPPPDASSFMVSTDVMAKCSSPRPQLIVFITARYQGRRAETNMVIINVKLLSGYVLEKSSVALLKRDRSVKRVDLEEGYVNIYLDGLRKDSPKLYSLTIEQDVAVRNLKPAVIKVYDYYQTSDEAVTEYTTPCAESDNVNEL